jgi:hypothetical protein
MARRTLAALIATTALLALIPAAASAHKPAGKYFCWSDGTYYGYLKLKAGSGKYSFNDRYTGEWTWKRRQKRIKFTSGYFSPEFYGVHRHESGDSDPKGTVFLRARGTTGTFRCG